MMCPRGGMEYAKIWKREPKKRGKDRHMSKNGK